MNEPENEKNTTRKKKIVRRSHSVESKSGNRNEHVNMHEPDVSVRSRTLCVLLERTTPWRAQSPKCTYHSEPSAFNRFDVVKTKKLCERHTFLSDSVVFFFLNTLVFSNAFALFRL